MRAILALMLALATPAWAQTLSPMTGTTASPPTAATPAARAHQPRRTLQQRFDEANVTHDGKLTLEQAKAAKLTRVVLNYDAIDAGKKGYVTMDDIHAFNRAQRAARKAAPH